MLGAEVGTIWPPGTPCALPPPPPPFALCSGREREREKRRCGPPPHVAHVKALHPCLTRPDPKTSLSLLLRFPPGDHAHSFFRISPVGGFEFGRSERGFAATLRVRGQTACTLTPSTYVFHNLGCWLRAVSPRLHALSSSSRTSFASFPHRMSAHPRPPPPRAGLLRREIGLGCWGEIGLLERAIGLLGRKIGLLGRQTGEQGQARASPHSFVAQSTTPSLRKCTRWRKCPHCRKCPRHLGAIGA